MSAMYAVVLRGCEAASLNTVTGLLGRAFSLKEATCSNILQSCPIILVDGLDENEAAAASLCLRTIEVAGAALELIPQDSEDLPKIDWPKKPTIFKQSLPALIRAYELPLNLNGSSYNLLDLLKTRLGGGDSYQPAAIPGTQQTAQTSQTSGSARLSSVHEFTGANLPEVTPFSNVALSDPEAAPAAAAPAPEAPAASSDDIGDRMNELFGEDDDELVPSSNHITNILDRILPDEEPGTGTIKPALNPATTSAPIAGPEVSGANQINSGGTGDFSLFLSKIPDAARRDKAVPLIAELAKIEKEEAEKLSKKVIIPVLRSVSKEEAEDAKHRFAEIGVLARVKNT